MFQANTVIFSSSGKSAVEIKRDNGDGTFATVMFTSSPNGGLVFQRADYVTPEIKIASILNDDLTNSD
jgi:hypothetical protein